MKLSEKREGCEKRVKNLQRTSEETLGRDGVKTQNWRA